MTESPAREGNGGDNPGDGSTSGGGGGDQAGHAQAPRSIDADLAASLALLRHMVGASGPGAGVAAGKLIVIEVPSVEWVDLVASVAPAAFLSGAGEPLAAFTGTRLTDDSPSWVVFQVSNAPFRRSVIEKDVAEAIQHGKTVFVVTQSVATLLAPCIPEAADQVLQLPSFGAETLAALIADTTGAPMQAVMPEMDFARLAPPTFRLARRAGQSADDYAARLAAMARPKELATPARLFEVFATRPGSEAAISQRLDAAYARAVKILTDAREGLELVAEALLRRIALTPAEVGAILVPRFIRTGTAAPPP